MRAIIGPLPMIGYTRAQGVERIRVNCVQGCGHSGMVEIDRLGMLAVRAI
jgi:hypothetical protein